MKWKNVSSMMWMNDEAHPDPPTRLCCGKKHWDVICPDGKVMCCLCFNRFSIPDLWTDGQGETWDICRECGEHEEVQRLGRGLG